MTDNNTASIAGFELDVETIDDHIEKAIVEHEFPYRDGAKLEDTGLKARRITVRCYFLNDRYDLHKDFLATLEKRDLTEFVHPRYGLMEGKIKSVSVRHDDRLRTAEIDLVFIQNFKRGPEPTVGADVDSGMESLFEEGQTAQAAEFGADMSDALGADAAQIGVKVLDPDKGLLEQFSDLAGKARDFVSTVDGMVSSLESTLNEIANPANSLIATIDYAANLPGRVAGSVAKTVERYSKLYDTLKSGPGRFVQSLRFGVDRLKASLPQSSKNPAKQAAIDAIHNQIDIAAAQRVALDLGYIFADDQTNRQKAKRLEKSRSFDRAGRYVKPSATPAMLTARDIEKSLAGVKAYAQEVIDENRGMTAPKKMALALQEHAAKVMLESEKLVKISLDNTLPLHIVCLMRGLPYNYAARILAVNDIPNPNFVQGDLKVYVG